MSTSCDRVTDDLSALVDGDRDAIARHAEHLAACDQCRDARHDATTLAEQIAASGADYVVAGDDLVARLMARVDAEVPVARVAPPTRVLKPAAATAPATLPNRSAPTLRASFEPTLRASFDETPVPAVEIPDSGAEAIAAETHEEEASANEHLAQVLQAGERINFARPPRRGSWYLKVAGLTAVSLLKLCVGYGNCLTVASNSGSTMA